MKKIERHSALLVCLSVLGLFFVGLVFIGCNKPNTSYNENTLSGAWDGNIQGSDVAVIVADYEGVPSPYKLGGWLISIPANKYIDTGTYATIDGVTINLYSNALRGSIVGTATLGENNTMSITLNRNSIAAGTHTLTRKK
jgi:hypothetical protein